MGESKIGVLVKQITYADTTAILVGNLPANSMIIGVEVAVATLFNSGGADVVDVGIATDPDRYANDINVASTGVKAGTVLVTGAVESATNPTEIKAVYVPAATAPSAGTGYVIVKYVQL